MFIRPKTIKIPDKMLSRQIISVFASFMTIHRRVLSLTDKNLISVFIYVYPYFAKIILVTFVWTFFIVNCNL